VLRLAIDHLGEALAAGAAAAEVGRLHAGRLDGFQQGLGLAHLDLDLRPGEHGQEGRAAGVVAEALVLHGGRRPAETRGSRLRRIQQADRAAYIGLRA
jgi:hypothetical protein